MIKSHCFKCTIFLAAWIALVQSGAPLAQNLPLQGAACPPVINNGKHCTANSMRVSAVAVNAAPAYCNSGDTISLRVGVTVGTGQNRAAKERYDLGFWVGETGTAVLGGTACAFSALLPAVAGPAAPDLTSGTGPYRAINSNQCGDILDAELTYHEFEVDQIVCQDTNNDGKLDMPMLVGWQQSKNNTGCAAVNDANDPTQAANFVQSLFPQTSSSCWSNGGAPIDIDEITVEPPATMEVYKTVAPRVLRSGAGEVTFEIEVFNESDRGDELTLTNLVDSEFGDLNGQGTCAVGARLASGARYRCEFQELLTGGPGDTHDNTVEATLTDDYGVAISDTDSARVRFIDIGSPPEPDIRVIKTAAPSVVSEPGGPIRYQVEVWNDGETNLELTALDDSRGGIIASLDQEGSCALPQTIGIGLSYSCEYTMAIIGRAPATDVNTVTATAQTPLTGQQVTDTDSATVTFRDTPAVLRLTKLPFPAVIQDRTAVTYELVLENHSVAKTITVTTLSDSYHGNVVDLGLDCGDAAVTDPLALVLPPKGATIECTFTGTVPETGEAIPIDTAYFPDTVTASGTADDGSAVTAEATAEVQFIPAGAPALPAPVIEVNKIAVPDRVPATGADVTFAVELINASASEAVLIDELVDDVHGNLSGRGTCDTISNALPIAVAAGAIYRCQFTENLRGDTGFIERDTIFAVGVGQDSDEPVIGFDTASVQFEAVPMDISLIKTPSANLIDPGDEVTFSLIITNRNDYPVEVFTLTDSVYGDLNGRGTCELPETLQAGDLMRCEFSEAPEPNVRERVHNNVVTATARPAGSQATRGATVSATDQAWVLFSAAIATIPVPVPTIPHGLIWVFGIFGLIWVRKRYQQRG